MDSAQIEYETALDMARRGREAWLEEPTRENFVVWKEASDTAHRWHRTIRLSGDKPKNTETELDEILNAG
jgi:hypothetical protein